MQRSKMPANRCTIRDQLPQAGSGQCQAGPEQRSRRVAALMINTSVEVSGLVHHAGAALQLVGFFRQRREKTMIERLANEILDASNGLGAAVKRRDHTDKMAEANRAFASYRWR